MIELLIYKFILCFLSGLLNAGGDTMIHHFNQSAFRFWDLKYWDPKISWSNKYTRPKWIPVELTDGWHLFKWFFLAFLFVGVALPSSFLHWYWNAGYCWTAFFIGFWLGYNALWLKK